MTRALGKPAIVGDLLDVPLASRVGGNLALDFCNTAGEHLSVRPMEKFIDWEAFVRWAVQIGLIAPHSYDALQRKPAALAEVLQLREAIYRVAVALARGKRIAPRDLITIRKHANKPKPHVITGLSGLRWRPVSRCASPQLCAILASEALSLFCSPRAARIRICEGGNCGWVFLDESRSKRRRWCDMRDCGNRAKAQRYYQQHKASPGSKQ
jgi:predicted RNA-binding Zn ribbon-like protein